MIGELIPVGGEELSVGERPTHLSVPTGATHALITFEKQPIRWSMREAPTGTFGIRQPAGDALEWMDPATSYQNILVAIMFIQDQTATGEATLQVQYFSVREIS